MKPVLMCTYKIIKKNLMFFICLSGIFQFLVCLPTSAKIKKIHIFKI